MTSGRVFRRVCSMWLTAMRTLSDTKVDLYYQEMTILCDYILSLTKNVYHHIKVIVENELV